MTTPNCHQRGPTELHPFADIHGRNIRSLYDLRHHGKKVCQQMLRRTNHIRVVGGTTCVWQKQDLRTVYIATQCSVAEYAAVAWTPWLSSSNIEKLERTQLQAARVITSAPRQQRLSCMKLTFPGSNIGLKR